MASVMAPLARAHPPAVLGLAKSLPACAL